MSPTRVVWVCPVCEAEREPGSQADWHIKAWTMDLPPDEFESVAEAHLTDLHQAYFNNGGEW